MDSSSVFSKMPSSMDCDSRRQTFLHGGGDILSFFVNQHVTTDQLDTSVADTATPSLFDSACVNDENSMAVMNTVNEVDETLLSPCKPSNKINSTTIVGSGKKLINMAQKVGGRRMIRAATKFNKENALPSITTRSTTKDALNTTMPVTASQPLKRKYANITAKVDTSAVAPFTFNDAKKRRSVTPVVTAAPTINKMRRASTRMSMGITKIKEEKKATIEVDAEKEKERAAEMQRLRSDNMSLRVVSQWKSATYQLRWQHLQEQLQEAQSKIQQLEMKIQILNSQIDDVQGENKEKQAEMEKLVGERASLQSQLSLSAASELMLREAAGALQGEIETMKLRSEESEKRAQQDMERVKQEANEEIERIKANVSAQAQEYMKERDVAHVRISSLQASESNLLQRISQLESQVQELNAKRETDAMWCKKLNSQLQDITGSIRVFCRIRPGKSLGDQSSDDVQYMKVKDESGLTDTLDFYAPTSMSADGCYARKEKSSFTFDRVFHSDAQQHDVFAELSDVVCSAMDGRNVSVFAYGQTGSGKTHTMMGPDLSLDADPAHRGMIPRTVDLIFAKSQDAAEKKWKYEFKASLVEVYNEEIRDLLNVNSNAKEPKIQHDRNGRVTVQNLEIAPVFSPVDVHKLLAIAGSSRTVAKTNCNDQSSRSHTVFQLYIEGENGMSGEKLSSILSLVDLAGSERIDQSKVTGKQLEETKCINASLSALSGCISAIASKSAHIPFRDSTVTHMLQDCLSGNSKTLFFTNISPEPHHWNESLCTLRFAEKLKNCSLNPTLSARPAKKKPITAQKPLKQ